jgi:hypothetical protein
VVLPNLAINCSLISSQLSLGYSWKTLWRNPEHLPPADW